MCDFKFIIKNSSYLEQNSPKLLPVKQNDLVASAASDPIVEINSKWLIKNEIEKLFNKFTDLVVDVQKELRIAIEKESSLLLDITTFARECVREKNLQMQDNIYDLFAMLQVHYDFLNCELIDAIINKFLKRHQLQVDMKRYLEELDSFLDSPTLLDIKESIEEGLIATHNGTETTCKVVIRLTGRWGKFPFKAFQDVIHFIISKELIAHIDIRTGSLLVTFLAPVSHSLNIAGKALTKTNFMQRVGIIEMYISDCGNNHYIMKPQNEENINYNHSLLEAAEGGYDFDVSVLIKLGANVNYIHTENGSTALTLASENGHYQVVELLLKEHADVNHQRQDGVTALTLASENGHYQVVELLCKKHADVNYVSQKENTALTLKRTHPNSLLAMYKARSSIETARKVLSLTKSSAANVPEVRRLLNCLENDGYFLSKVAKEQIEELEREENNLHYEMREINNMKKRHELEKQALLEKSRSDLESSRIQHERVLQYAESKKEDAEDSLYDAKANLIKEQEKTGSRLLKGMAGGTAAGLAGGAGAGAGIGAAIGIIGGPIGIAVGAVIGATADGLAGGITEGVSGTAGGTAIALKYPNGKVEEAKRHYDRCHDEVYEAENSLESIKTSLESLETRLQLCNTLLWNAERRATQAHERIGAIKTSIAFMKEAVFKWGLLKEASKNATANTTLLREIVRIADETKTYQIITSDGTTREVRSFLQAWEKVSSIHNLTCIK